jgi:hypothetical protein
MYAIPYSLDRCPWNVNFVPLEVPGRPESITIPRTELRYYGSIMQGKCRRWSRRQRDVPQDGDYEPVDVSNNPGDEHQK